MKKWRRIGKVAFVCALTLVLSVQVYAGSMEDEQQRKQEAEEDRNRAQNILNGLESEKANLEVYIADLDSQMAEIQKTIQDYAQQQEDLEGQIVIKQAELAEAKEKEANQYTEMCSRIQFMYENGEGNFGEAMLAIEDMSDVLNQPEYASAVADYDYQMLQKLIQIREEIANDEQQLQNDLDTVERLKEKKEGEEATVEELLAAKAKEMSSFDNQIESQKKIIEQCDAEIQAAMDRIRQIEAQAMNNSGGTFVPYSGGALTWPVPSSTRINSPFGRREASGVVTANHFGVDIGCPDGTPVVAAASGVVVIARYSATAGNWIIISHGNGLYTVYMHASVLYVSEGQYVNAGDTIMLSGATGATQGRHLHFEVCQGGISPVRSVYAVDPLTYFQ